MDEEFGGGAGGEELFEGHHSAVCDYRQGVSAGEEGEEGGEEGGRG